MVREKRLKVLSFDSTDLAADASGNLSTYADKPVNGEVVKVNYDSGTIATNGSLSLETSGANTETIWHFNGANSDTVDYLGASVLDSARGGSVAGNMTAMELGPRDGVLRVWGSGCGPTSGATRLDIYYK